MKHIFYFYLWIMVSNLLMNFVMAEPHPPSEVQTRLETVGIMYPISLKVGEAVLPTKYKNCTQIGMGEEEHVGKYKICKAIESFPLKLLDKIFISIGGLFFAAGIVLTSIGLFKLGHRIGKNSAK